MFWKKRRKNRQLEIPEEFKDMRIKDFEEKLIKIDELVEEGYILSKEHKILIAKLKTAISDLKRKDRA